MIWRLYLITSDTNIVLMTKSGSRHAFNRGTLRRPHTTERDHDSLAEERLPVLEARLQDLGAVLERDGERDHPVKPQRDQFFEMEAI